MRALVGVYLGIARNGETTDCVAAEASAREEKVGLWQGEFRMAEAF